jgi:hypothetical protein
VQKKERGRRKEGEADQWVPAVSDSKKKKRGGGSGLTREAGWAAWVEKSRGVSFVFFFFFSFLNLHFQILFQLKFKSNFFKLFSRI